MDLWQLVIRLGIASISGGLIGLERERHNRPAGLRTHMLVAVGSALIMIISIAVAQDYSGTADPSRIAAQVVSGIGFLGAGTIIRDGFNIRGLTTAASLWVVSAIGLAAGAGYPLYAIAVTVLTLATLILLSYFERTYFRGKNQILIQVRTVDKPSQLSRVAGVLGNMGIEVRNVVIEEASESDEVELSITVRIPAGISESRMTEALLTLEHIHRIEIVK